jgi:hypothetical protein
MSEVMRTAHYKTVLHAMMLNALWFSVVLGVAYAHKITALVVFALMVLLAVYEGLLRSDVVALVLGLVVGVALDGFMQHYAWVSYGQWFNDFKWLPPVWILMLWVGFALSLKIGMRWLFKRYWIGAVFLGIGAPLSYFSAEKLGAVSLHKPLAVMVLLALGWLFYYSMLYVINSSWRTAYES